MRSVLVRFRIPLVIVVAVLLAVGVLGLVRAHQVGGDSSTRNVAVVDKPATTSLVTTVSRELVAVLSYSWDDPATTTTAAAQVLTGGAQKQQRTLFAELAKKAPGQKLVLSARVEAAGVTRLDGDHATLLVFLDQSSQRAKDKQATVSAAQLRVDAVRTADTWKISSLTPL